MTHTDRPASMFLLYALVLALSSIVLAVLVPPIYAAPSRLDCQTVAITAPTADSTLSGVVEIRGQAVISNFQFYKVEYSPVERERWTLIGTDVIRNAVQNGLLVTWQTGQVPEGTYRLRLRAVDSTGNYCEAIVDAVDVSRVQPTETPPPEPTETPVLTAVPPLPTVTIVRKPTLEVGPILNQPGPIPTRSAPIDLPEVNTSGVVTFFVFGVLVMLALLLLAGLIMFVRRWG